jgi:branched-chain amino acid transport system substrate-binding protein
MRALLVLGVALLVAVGCSFTTARGFEECRSDADCGTGVACSRGYCLPLPTGCSREPGAATEDPSRIPMVALLPLTSGGVRDNSEEQGLNAMRLALGEANQRQGLKNRLFGLFVCDTGAPGADQTTQLRWMVQNLEVPAAIVAGSGATQAAGRDGVRVDAGTLIISNTATSPALASTYRNEGNVWRVAPSDTFQSRVLASLLRQDFPDAGGTTVGILNLTSVYGTDFGVALAETLRETGFQVTQKPYVSGDPTNQTSAVTELSNERPHATVLIAFPPDVTSLIGLARSRMPLWTTNGHRWYLTDAAKDLDVLIGTLPDLDGALGTAAAQGAGGAFASFRDAFRTRFLIDPNSLSYTSHSYDAMWLVMLAAAAASEGGGGVTGPRLGEGMRKLVATSQAPIPLRADKWVEASDLLLQGSSINVEGASSALDFDLDTGAPVAPYEIWQIRDGGIGFVRQVNP